MKILDMKNHGKIKWIYMYLQNYSNFTCTSLSNAFALTFLSFHEYANEKRSSDGINLKLPTEMAEIKVAKKTIFFHGKDSWSSPQIIPQVDFHIGQVLINKYWLKT